MVVALCFDSCYWCFMWVWGIGVHLWSLFCVLFYFKFGNFSVLLGGLFIVGFGVWLVFYFELAVWICA